MRCMRCWAAGRCRGPVQWRYLQRAHLVPQRCCEHKVFGLHSGIHLGLQRCDLCEGIEAFVRGHVPLGLPVIALAFHHFLNLQH